MQITLDPLHLQIRIFVIYFACFAHFMILPTHYKIFMYDDYVEGSFDFICIL